MSGNFVFDNLPDDALVRQHQLIARADLPGFAILPFSAPTLWRKVKNGTFPAPIKVSRNITAWRIGDVRSWLRTQTGGRAHG